MITIEKVRDLQSDSSAAIVSATGSLNWQKGVMALATNASSITGHPTSQREANDAEKAIAKRLAMDEFRKHKVPEELAKEMQFEQATITNLEQGSSGSLIAYVFIKTETAVHEVFLIAKLNGSDGAAEFTRYHVTKDVE